MANRRSFFVPVVVGLLMVVGATNIFSQTRDYDFASDGKPVQTGGPGLGQPQTPAQPPTPAPATPPSAQPPAPTLTAPVPGQPGQPGIQSQPPAPGQPPTPTSPAQPPTPPTPTPSAFKIPAMSSVLPWLLGFAFVVGVIILIVVLRSRRTGTPPPRPHTPGPGPHVSAPGPHAPPAPHTSGPGTPGGPRPVISPAARAAGGGRPAPPAGPPPAAPVPPPAPATPAPAPPPPAPGPIRPPVATPPAPATPAPAPVAPKPGTIITPIIALLFALLFGAQAVRAADYTVFPSAVAMGSSVNAIVTGPNANALTGCGVALPDSGCSLSHVVSATQVMVRLTAGPNAMGTDPHPVRGTLRLVFGGTTINLPNAVVVGRSEQIGVAMISPHANPAPQVINRTTVQYRTDPATMGQVAALRTQVAELERWRASVLATSTLAPAPVPSPAAPVSAASSAPAPVASAAGGSAQLAQMQQTMLQVQSSLENQGRRIDGLVSQVAGMGKTVEAVNANNERLVRGLGVVGGYTALALRKKDQRCALVADLRAAGVPVVNPPANCK